MRAWSSSNDRGLSADVGPRRVAARTSAPMTFPTYVLGVNAYHGDVAAVLLRDGELVAALEEERFRRIKHWAGFPTFAIQRCLEIAGVAGRDVRHVAVSRDPKANLLRKG